MIFAFKKFEKHRNIYMKQTINKKYGELPELEVSQKIKQ